MPKENVNPGLMLNDLLDGASPRKRNSLRLLDQLLKQHHEANEKDFSIATIGRLSSQHSGPSTQSIRNKTGADYRHLILAWATYSDTNIKKPSGNTPNSSKEFDILQRIPDPAVRAVMGSVIAERNVLLKENRILKNQTELIIDKRPPSMKIHRVEVVPSITGLLNEMELEALEHAISPTTLGNMGWKTDKSGRVKSGRVHIFKAGYVTAISKLLNLVAS